MKGAVERALLKGLFHLRVFVFGFILFVGHHWIIRDGTCIVNGRRLVNAPETWGMKRWLELVLVLVVIGLFAWFELGDGPGPTPAGVDVRSHREVEVAEDPNVEMLWTVEPTYFWYRKFELRVIGDETGARWTAELVPRGSVLGPTEPEPTLSSEGSMDVKEWGRFLQGLRRVGGWGWADLGLGEEPMPTDMPYYTLTLTKRGDSAKGQRFYGLPTGDHQGIALYVDQHLAGAIRGKLEQQWRERQKRR